MDSIFNIGRILNANTTSSKSVKKVKKVEGIHQSKDVLQKAKKRHIAFKSNAEDELYIEIRDEDQNVLRVIPADEENVLFQEMVGNLKNNKGGIIDEES